MSIAKTKTPKAKSHARNVIFIYDDEGHTSFYVNTEYIKEFFDSLPEDICSLDDLHEKMCYINELFIENFPEDIPTNIFRGSMKVMKALSDMFMRMATDEVMYFDGKEVSHV